MQESPNLQPTADEERKPFTIGELLAAMPESGRAEVLDGTDRADLPNGA